MVIKSTKYFSNAMKSPMCKLDNLSVPSVYHRPTSNKRQKPASWIAYDVGVESGDVVEVIIG